MFDVETILTEAPPFLITIEINGDKTELNIIPHWYIGDDFCCFYIFKAGFIPLLDVPARLFLVERSHPGFWRLPLFIYPQHDLSHYCGVIFFSRGLFFRRTDTVELFRVKDDIVTRSLMLQLFGLMDMTLKTTDPENPEVWLRGITYSNLIDILRDRIIETRKHNRIYEIN